MVDKHTVYGTKQNNLKHYYQW